MVLDKPAAMQRAAEVLRENGFDADGLSRLTSYSNAVFGTDEIVIRIGERDYSREAELIRTLWARDLPVPEVLADGPGYMVLKRLEGTVLRDYDATPETYRAIGAALRSLHEITGDNEEFVRFIDGGVERSLQRGIPEKVKRFLASVEWDRSADRLIHCDLSASNIIIASEPYFVDFEWSKYGDPLYDLAYFETKHPDRFMPAFHEGYGEPRGDPARILFYNIVHDLEILDWAERTGADKVRDDKIERLARHYEAV